MKSAENHWITESQKSLKDRLMRTKKSKPLHRFRWHRSSWWPRKQCHGVLRNQASRVTPQRTLDIAPHNAPCTPVWAHSDSNNGSEDKKKSSGSWSPTTLRNQWNLSAYFAVKYKRSSSLKSWPNYLNSVWHHWHRRFITRAVITLARTMVHILMFKYSSSSPGAGSRLLNDGVYPSTPKILRSQRTPKPHDERQ